MSESIPLWVFIVFAGWLMADGVAAIWFYRLIKRKPDINYAEMNKSMVESLNDTARRLFTLELKSVKPKRCRCCEKLDFPENMVRLREEDAVALGIISNLWYGLTPDFVYVHAECAGIVKCECGAGWAKEQAEIHPALDPAMLSKLCDPDVDQVNAKVRELVDYSERLRREHPELLDEMVNKALEIHEIRDKYRQLRRRAYRLMASLIECNLCTECRSEASKFMEELDNDKT